MPTRRPLSLLTIQILLILNALTQQGCDRQRQVITPHARLTHIRDDGTAPVRSLGDATPRTLRVLSVTPEHPNACATTDHHGCVYTFPHYTPKPTQPLPIFSQTYEAWSQSLGDQDWHAVVVVESPEPAFDGWLAGGIVTGVLALSLPAILWASSTTSDADAIDAFADGAVIFSSAMIGMGLGALLGVGLHKAFTEPQLILSPTP
jgi:hypothetical protein